MSAIVITSQEDFDNQVLQAKQPVLVDFWAPWCGPCKMVTPEVEAVAEAYVDKALVCKVNVDEQQTIASSYNVKTIPTMLIIKDGKEINRIVGYRPRKDLSKLLDDAL